MIPLTSIQQTLAWFCICPFAKSTSGWKKKARFPFTLIIFAMFLGGLVSSVAFFYKFSSTNLEGSLYALSIIIAFGGMFYVALVALIMRHKITTSFGSLTKIYDASKNDEGFQFLMEVNKTCEWIVKIYLKFVPTAFAAGLMLSSFGSILSCFYKHGTFINDSIHRPFNVILPWNQQTLLGFVGEICFDICFGEAYMFLNGSLLLLFISMCLHHQQFYAIFRHSLEKMDASDHQHRNDKIILCQLMRFHISTKGWFMETANVYSLIIMIHLLYSMMFCALVIFQLDLIFRRMNFGVLVLLLGIANSTLNIFLYCFFGGLASDNFKKMATRLYKSNWLEIHIGLQKYFILMIGNAQRPLYYDGFGIVILNLETFTMFLRAIYTCYMMFKAITTE